MKKILTVVMSMILLMLIMTISVAAASESESNDSMANATTISTNTNVSGNLSTKSDVDWYKFTTTSDGYFNVAFTHDFESSSSDYWKVYLYNSSGNNIDGTSSYFGVDGNANMTTNTFGVPAGTYYIKIVKDYYSGKNYNLKVNFTSSSDWETEDNNSKDTADTIEVNDGINGSLSMNGDVDWYKFTTTSNGYFNVEFTHDFVSSSSDYWKVYLYNSTGVNNIDGSSSYFAVDGNANMTTNTFGVPAGTYYIKIVKDYYSGNNYNLKVNFTSSSDWETENNNTKETANIIEVNDSINGSLSMNGDVDWYKFTTTSNGYFNVEFTHDFVSSSSDYWKVYLYNSTGVNNIDGSSSYFAVDGNANMTTNTFGVPAGTYYIKIVKDYYSGNNYNLKVNFTSSSDWETEDNNSKNTANIIKVNKSVNGSLSMNGDVDWYTFNVSSNCEIAVTFNHEVIDSSSTYWKFYIYDNTGVTELLSYGRKGNTETATTDYISLSPGQYYIKVVKDYYSGKNYSLVVQEKHDCWGDFLVSKDATCTQDGMSEKRCNICNKLLESKTIPADHKYADWIIDSEASCSEYGSKHHTCSVCGYTETEQIEKEAHIFGEWSISKDPTCSEDGEQIHTCSNCQLIERENITHLEHKYGEWIVVGGSKIIPPIVKEKTCELCGNTERFNDWSYIWVTIIAGIAVVGILIGVINYIKGMKKTKNK